MESLSESEKMTLVLYSFAHMEGFPVKSSILTRTILPRKSSGIKMPKRRWKISSAKTRRSRIRIQKRLRSVLWSLFVSG